MNKKLYSVLLIFLAVTISGCSPMSRAEFEAGQAGLKANPVQRGKIISRCASRRSHDSKADRENISAILNIQPSNYAKTYCSRLYNALASGRISYEDYLAADREGNYAAIVKALRR